MAGADLVWENSTAGWLADKPSEYSDCSLNLDLRSLLMLLMTALNDMFLHELETASSNLQNKDTHSNMKCTSVISHS